MKADAILKKITALTAAFPETGIEQNNGHVAFLVRNKKYGWLLNNHHGDGMLCLCVKVDPEEKEFLIDLDPEKYLRPAYVSRFGWLSIRLDRGVVDWRELEERMIASYRIVAPKGLSAMLKSGSSNDA